MEMRDKLSIIEGIVASNKISVHKKFNLEYLTKNDFYPEARIIAEDAVEKIFQLCAVGVNEGFNGAIKDAITDLSYVVFDLTKLKDSDFKKLNEKIKGVEKVSIPTRKTTKLPDSREVLLKYITTTIGAVDSILTHDDLFGKNAEAQRDNLLALKDKMSQLQEKLGHVTNLSSKQSVEYVKRITAELLYVRQQLSRLFCTLEVVSRVDKAMAIVDEWAQLTAATDKRHLAKPEDLPVYAEDNISALANSAQALDQLRLFTTRFAIEEDNLVNSPLIQDLRTREGAIATEIAGIMTEAENLFRKKQNNGLTAQEELHAKDLLRRRQNLEAEKTNLLQRIKLEERMNSQRLQMLQQFKREVYEPMMREKQQNPMQLCVTVSLMDFGSVLGMLGVDITPDSIQAASRTIATAKVQAEQRERNLRQAYDQITQVMGIMDERQQSRLQQDGIVEEQVTETQPEQIDDVFEALLRGNPTSGGNTQQNTQQNETTTEEIVTSIPLTEDDQ